MLPTLLIAVPLLARPPIAPEPPHQVEAADRAAWASGLEITWDELDPVLVRRYAMTSAGREVLQHLLQTRLLDKMAAEREMVVSKDDVDGRIRILDDQIKLQGDPGGIQGQLRDNEVDVAEFRELMRILIIQERLCREALGLPPGAPVSGDKQELWIQEEMAGRGLDAPPPPWKDGVAGRCGTVRVTADEYVREMRTALPIDDVRETCYQLVVLKGIRARMPDLAPEALESAVEQEIERRRRNAEADPRYKGMSFEHLLSTQGMTLDSLRADASVQVVALSRLWVSRSYANDDLRRVYEEERTHFDSRYGEALRVRVLFLNAAVFTNTLNPRSFDEARAELERLRERIATEADFEALAGRHSEDAATRGRGGELGWVRRTGEGLAALREALFDDLDQNGPPDGGGRLLGPIAVEDGAVLAWIAEHRPAPGWSTMKLRVQGELRLRFVEDVLPRSELVTFLDA